MNPVHTVDELFQFDGHAFVERCYASILGRPSDSEGMAHYVRLLSQGVSKAQIAIGMVQSEEARYLGRQDTPLGRSIMALQDSRPPSLSRFFSRGLKALRSVEATQSTAMPEVDSSVAQRGVASATATFGAHQRLKKTPQSATVVVQPTKGYRFPAQESRDLSKNDDAATWFDITTSLHWGKRPSAIVNAELNLAAALRAEDESIRFFARVAGGIAEIDVMTLPWFNASGDVVPAYADHFSGRPAPAKISLKVPEDAVFFHPFGKNDIIFSAGWMDGRREGYLSAVKEEQPTVVLGAVVHDVALIGKDTHHFANPTDVRLFSQYLEWVSHVCDIVLVGSDAAAAELKRLQVQKKWPCPPTRKLPLAHDLASRAQDDDALPRLRSLEDMGIDRPFILADGTITPINNFEMLYRAYLMALEISEEQMPLLVIHGEHGPYSDDLMDTLDRDPRLKGNLVRLTPAEADRETLYNQCCYTVLPSLDQSWRQPLFRGLTAGKFGLAAATPQLREMGGALLDYIDPVNVRAWANAMVLYASDDALLTKRESMIATQWKPVTWSQSADVLRAVFAELKDRSIPATVPAKIFHPDWDVPRPVIWMDMSLTFLHWGGGIGGIVRAELTFAYYLKKLEPHTRFFASAYGGFFEINPELLWWLFDSTDLTTSYKFFQSFWAEQEGNATAYRDPFRLYPHPPHTHPAYLSSLPENSIAFFAAIDFAHINADGTPELHRIKDVLTIAPHDRGVMLSQLIYDFTPILFPHVHKRETCEGYAPFIDFVSNHFDHLVYGGRTARRDGLRFQADNNLKSPPSDFVEFGSDLALSAKPAIKGKALADIDPAITKNGTDDSVASPATVDVRKAPARALKTAASPAKTATVEAVSVNEAKRKLDDKVLKSLGVKGRFVMTVGTIEPRKNHETLYKAFLRILESNALDEPLQLVIVGPRGWKSGDLLAILENDDRIVGTILVRNPTDDELEVLYQNCAFTLLPSFYEGWSLTLPESLSHEKFCLVADTDPLRETGGDLVEYIHPLDVDKWADRIIYYANNRDVTAQRVKDIKANWHARTWKSATLMLTEALFRQHKTQFGLDRLTDYARDMVKVKEG